MKLSNKNICPEGSIESFFLLWHIKNDSKDIDGS